MHDAENFDTEAAAAAIPGARQEQAPAPVPGRASARVGHNREPHLGCASCQAPATHAVTRRDGTELTTSCGEHLDVWVRRLSV
jgi:hypothetical protein